MWRLAFSPDGNLLAVGCLGGHLYIFGVVNSQWAQVAYIKHYTESVRVLYLFSPFCCHSD